MEANKTIKISLFTVLVISVAVLLTACGGKPEGYTMRDGSYINDTPAAVAIILGNHANAMEVPEDAYSAIEHELRDVVYGGYVCVIISDSTPTKIDLVPSEYYRQDAKNPEILEKRITTRTSELIELIKNVGTADSMEVDLLGSIREATNALQTTALESIKDKRIIVVDTGISTSGDLDFTTMDVQKGAPKADSVVNLLKSNNVLPNLKDIAVTFIGTTDGLAETAEPQKMETKDKIYIKELWETIVKSCEAASVKFISSGGWSTPNKNTEDSESRFPHVSVIPFYHESAIDLSGLQNVGDNDPDGQPDMPDPYEFTIKLESETVGFKPDEAEYYNDSVAKGILSQYAVDLKAYLDSYPDEVVWLVGTSATTHENGDGDLSLSLRRAEKVKQTLVDELGVPGDRLITIGLGAKFPWHVNEFVNGKFDTDTAQNNRAVWIMNTVEENKEFTMITEAYEKGELLSEAMSRFTQLVG